MNRKNQSKKNVKNNQNNKRRQRGNKNTQKRSLKNRNRRGNNKQKGGNCGIESKPTPCPSAINVGQYIRPCSYLPLDDPKHDISKSQIGGRKQNKNNRNKKQQNQNKQQNKRQKNKN